MPGQLCVKILSDFPAIWLVLLLVHNIDDSEWYSNIQWLFYTDFLASKVPHHSLICVDNQFIRCWSSVHHTSFCLFTYALLVYKGNILCGWTHEAITAYHGILDHSIMCQGSCVSKSWLISQPFGWFCFWSTTVMNLSDIKISNDCFGLIFWHQRLPHHSQIWLDNQFIMCWSSVHHTSFWLFTYALLACEGFILCGVDTWR